MARRQKTPETWIGARFRAYAKNYAANGQKLRAEVMLECADMADGMLNEKKGGEPAPLFEEALRNIVARVEWLERAFKRFETAAPAVQTPKKPLPLEGAEPTHKKPNGALSPLADAPLQPGEESVLAAIVQFGGTTGLRSEELVAITARKHTSMRTYITNLVVLGYVTRRGGYSVATDDGRARVANHAKMPIGKALYEQWLGRLSPGEQKILRAVWANREVATSALCGEATGLQATSVRTYVTELRRRELIVRPSKGRIALAPALLREGVSS